MLALLPLSAIAQNTFDVALIGDMPYGTALEPAYERVIADINRANPAFTAFVGDTKSGSTRCDDSHYTQALNWFNMFETALVYSVGDNEWTDCLRVNNGSYDPLGRLALVRRTFFPTNMSLGKQPIAVIRQSDDPQFALYRENQMWVKGPVLFVAIHMPGSNNNLEYKSAQGVPNAFYDNDREYNARNAANLAWTRLAFATAKQRGLLGVMILTQANMFETYLDTSTGASRSGFEDFMKLLREETGNFGGDVVLVHGDTHYALVDKPLSSIYPPCPATLPDCRPDTAGGTRLHNFTRVQLPGQNDVHWVKATIRPRRNHVFRFETMIVQENR